jgi:O-antigen/teichoic acid export membrane protein
MISPFGSQLAPLFFGQEWAESGSVLRWGAWAAPLVFAGTLWSLLMIVTNQQHLIFKVFLGMAVVNLTCNALLIPKLGADGAAISRIVTYASMFPLSLFWSGARHFGWTYNLQGLFPLLLAVSAGWGIQRLQIGLWWGLPLTGLVAAAGFWLTGWLGPARLRRFAQIFIHGEAVDRKE